MRPEEFPVNYQKGLAWAQDALNELMDEWGLELTLKSNGRLKKTLGYWWALEPRQLTIATFALIDRPFGVIVDTVAHEYAHALDYALRGKTDHSPAWREVAMACGARPRASSSTSESVEYQIKVASEEKR